MSSAGLGELQIRPERTRRVERAKEATRRWAFASLSRLAARVGNERETEPDEPGGVQPACVRGGGRARRRVSGRNRCVSAFCH